MLPSAETRRDSQAMSSSCSVRSAARETCGAPLALNTTHPLSVQRMPAILDHNVLPRGSNPCGYPHEPLVSYRINRQLSGWILPPLMIRAFGAHCHNRTYAVQQRRSLDHLVGEQKERFRDREPKCFRGLEVDS
jgi:hypothetical protein